MKTIELMPYQWGLFLISKIGDPAYAESDAISRARWRAKIELEEMRQKKQVKLSNVCRMKREA